MKSKRLTKSQIFLLICFGGFAIHYLFFRAPSEAQMIAKFKNHKAEFEKIRLILQQDKTIEVIRSDDIRAGWDGKNNRDLPLNVSPERLKSYRSLLQKLGFETVISRHKEINFYQFGGGFTDTSWSIGFSWMEKTPNFLVKSAYSDSDKHCLLSERGRPARIGKAKVTQLEPHRSRWTAG